MSVKAAVYYSNSSGLGEGHHVRQSPHVCSTRLKDAKYWQSCMVSYHSENTEENKTKQTGKNITFAEAWFHRPFLYINLPGTLTTVSSTPIGSVCTGNVFSQWLSWACGVRLHLTAGEAACSAVSQCAAAPSLQTSSSNAILSAASLHLHCSPLWPFVPGTQLNHPANQRSSCCSA